MEMNRLRRLRALHRAHDGPLPEHLRQVALRGGVRHIRELRKLARSALYEQLVRQLVRKIALSRHRPAAAPGLGNVPCGPGPLGQGRRLHQELALYRALALANRCDRY